MRNLIAVKENENLEQIVSGRELHEFLSVDTRYNDWFKRMTEYGFIKDEDYTPITQKRVTAQGNTTNFTDHAIKLSMAKEISMIQRNERGKQARRYFIDIERQWNSPDAVYARAIKMADRKLLDYRQQVKQLQDNLHHKTEVIKGMTDDVDIYKKRAVINRVVRYKGANFKERWTELYKAFREAYSVDLKARCEGHNLRQTKKKDQLSVIKYAEVFGHIDNLYLVASKLYETDVEDILEHLKKTA